MLKRIRYVSRQLNPMTDDQIDTLVEAAAVANSGKDITGTLAVSFQIIEEPSAAIDPLFAKIRADLRHRDVTCLDAQVDCEIRLFPDWAMRRVGRTSVGTTTSRMRDLVQALRDANEERQRALADELAVLMRSALRAA